MALYDVTCPFCSQNGNFELVNRVQKKKANGSKVLNYDTLKCGNCGNYNMVFWSAGSDLHSYRQVPWPLRVEHSPKHWPTDIGRYWLQAKRSLTDGNWDAAAVMARSALQVALRAKQAVGSNLMKEIDDLASKGQLPPIMREWSHELRVLGNDSAHPSPGDAATTDRDARDVISFLDYLLEYLFTLPHNIDQYRARRKSP